MNWPNKYDITRLSANLSHIPELDIGLLPDQPFTPLTNDEMKFILDEVLNVVKGWKSIAEKIGIAAKEQQLMEKAFRSSVEN